MADKAAGALLFMCVVQYRVVQYRVVQYCGIRLGKAGSWQQREAGHKGIRASKRRLATDLGAVAMVHVEVHNSYPLDACSPQQTHM